MFATGPWQYILTSRRTGSLESEAHLDQNVLAGYATVALASILDPSGGLFSDAARPCQRPAPPSCPKTQTNSRLARRAVSIVITPWRAPDQGRVGGDVGDSGSPHAQGKHRPATGCYAPWAKTWIQVLGKDGH